MSCLFQPPDGQTRESLLLAPYAMHAVASRGRQHPEPGDYPYRPAFQRDRERVTHCRAFRRLSSKTQVLAAHTNDHHRTRLTHTLEVAQVSRTVARMLGLNEDLAEAVALSHDLGHPPFGHAGERALNACMAGHGGFDHNLHALRIVDELETPYPAFAGLNLSWEVRSAFAHHSKRRDHPAVTGLLAGGEPLLEFTVVDLCDSLAYDTHDLDDALGLGLIAIDELKHMEFWRVGAAGAEARWPRLEPHQYRPAVVRALLEWQVLDLVVNTRRRLEQAGVRTVQDVRRTPDLARFSDEVGRVREELEAYLRERVYRHPRVAEMAEEGAAAVVSLFEYYTRRPEALPARHAARLATAEPARVVCDYLAGMTDRFALADDRRLSGSTGPV
jgi:dGTPase